MVKRTTARSAIRAQDAYKPPIWARYVTFPEGLGAWAVVLTLLAIVWQSIETRKSAHAAAESANAAYRALDFTEVQWELTREKERARLDITVQRDLEVRATDSDVFQVIATLSVRNIGTSRAFIRSASGGLISRIRSESPEENEESRLDLPEQFIDPDRPPVLIKVYCFPTATPETFAENLEQETFSLRLSGIIEYESPGGRWRKDFGYRWKILDRGLGSVYGIGDPYPNSPMPVRDRIAYGLWYANISSPEYAVKRGTQNAEQQHPN